ncbi:hypothetical protein ABU178_18160 [Pantoea osteomyelitidis]|uniref:Uncharacterized protein n=1 Tax=Pantoea osteomyelitidis TaxID=3230026 RepID=A0ABW7Q0G7_9GAMM
MCQLHTFAITQEDPEEEKIDGISLLSFTSLNDVADYLFSTDWLKIEAAESQLTNQENRNSGHRSITT